MTQTSSRRKGRNTGTEAVGGTPANLAVDSLQLDDRNPRLPESSTTMTPDELLTFIAREYAPIEIAKSIASHGYFQSEPLIVVKEGGENVVVEGNRRLAALLLLTDPSKAEELDLPDADEWEMIGTTVDLPARIPVVIAPSRKAVAPIIGYRHISGIEPWDPYAKARYLAGLVDKERRTFEDAASLVGETRGAVRTHYRNYRIARQAKIKFGADVSRARRSFGVFTRALQDENLRTFIKAPQAASVKPRKSPLPTSAKKPVEEFLSWVFGDDNNEPVLTDSRRLKELGIAVSTEEGRKVLRSTRDLSAAFAAAGGHQRRVVDLLLSAGNYLASARDGVQEFRGDQEVKKLVLDVYKTAAELKQLL